MKGFELGRVYERKSHEVFFHKFLGYSSIIGGWLFFAFAVWDWRIRLQGVIVLNLVGIISLWLGYDEAKLLKEIKQ